MGRVTPGKLVDSSAIITMPGWVRYAVALTSCRKLIASRFSRPPCTLGSHWPSSRE